MTRPTVAPVFGTSGADTLSGSDGNDIFFGNGGADVLDGRNGEDLVSFSDAPNGVSVNLGQIFGAAGSGSADGWNGHALLNSIEGIEGSQFNDTLKGDDDLSNYINGLGGNDSIDGGGGDDRLYGGNGNDTITGGSGNDLMEGGAGNDSIDGSSGGTGDTAVFSGKLSDYTVTFSTTTGAFTITDKTANRDGTDQVLNVQNFKFSDSTVPGTQLLAAANDKTPPTLSSSNPANAAVGVSVSGDIKLTFSENVSLGSGAIVLKDADGNVVATYTAASTANLSVAGAVLTIHFSAPLSASTGYTLELGADAVKDVAGNAYAGSLDYHFTTAGGGLNLAATASAPNLNGGVGDDTLTAGPGNGVLDGGAGNDVLLGSTGKTLMVGGAGNDILISGAGADTMQGGDGADLYYVNDAGDIVQELQGNAAQQIADGPHPDVGRSVDKVIASINYTLTAFVENLSLASASGSLSGSGNELNNVLGGNESSNVLNGKAGNDTIDGAAGTDTAQYSGKFSEYTLALGSGAAATTVTDKTANRDGADSLTNIERLKFSDLSLAMDLGATQAAGKTVLMMAVATSLGPLFVSSQQYAGLFLGYFDSGATLLDGANLLVSSGIIAAFAGGSDNISFVKMIYNNVYGKAPDAVTLNQLVGALDNHSTTQAQWLADMAASTANQQHVNLTGYAGTGLQYLPGA